MSKTTKIALYVALLLAAQGVWAKAVLFDKNPSTEIDDRRTVVDNTTKLVEVTEKLLEATEKQNELLDAMLTELKQRPVTR